MRSVDLKRIVFYSTIIALFTIAGCKKEEESTKTELLTREWMITTVGGVSALEYFDGDEVTLKFETDFDFKITYSFEGESETETGKWKFESNETELEIELNYEQYTWDIEKLTEDEFWFFDPEEGEQFKCSAK